MSQRKLPGTSLDAYAASHELSKAHKEKIIEALSEIGFANYEQIAVKANLDKHQIGRRLSELEEDKKILKSGITKPTSSGRPAYCYTIAAGQERKKIQVLDSGNPGQPTLFA